MIQVRKIGVLTSGGDAPGMNAAVRAVVRSAAAAGIETIGVYRGYQGLIDGDFKPLTDVSGIIQRGGTVLYTARCEQFFDPEFRMIGIELAKQAGMDGLVVIGGDGSFRGARCLSMEGLPTVGIPATIDNDIACSEYTIGFDTAANVALEAIDRLRDTSMSHHRCSVVEVMGRHAGFLALEVGVASGALAVVVPERECNLETEIFDRIRAGGMSQYIVVVAEGASVPAHIIAEQIEEQTGMQARLTVLGHVQRGGAPTARDRVTATRMGERAVELLRHGIGNRVVAVKSSHIIDYDIGEALEMTKGLDEKLYLLCSKVAGSN